jgi:hypothetical protein
VRLDRGAEEEAEGSRCVIDDWYGGSKMGILRGEGEREREMAEERWSSLLR